MSWRCFWRKISKKALIEIRNIVLSLVGACGFLAAVGWINYMASNNPVVAAIIALIGRLIGLYFLVGMPVLLAYLIYDQARDAIRETIEECKE